MSMLNDAPFLVGHSGHLIKNSLVHICSPFDSTKIMYLLPLPAKNKNENNNKPCAACDQC